MKRPFAVVGITYLIAQTVAVLSGFTVTAVLLGLTLLCALVLFAFVRQRPVWLVPVVLSCVVCFGAFTLDSLLTVRPSQMLEGQKVYVSGMICEPPVQSYGRYHYVIKTDSVLLDSAPQEVLLRLSSAKDLDAEYGDSIDAVVQINNSRGTSASERGLLAEGITLTAYLPYNSVPTLEKGGPSLYGWILSMRESFCSAAKRLMGDELGGLLIGMFTGDTSGIDNVTLAEFRDCGLSHLFAVSGLHLSIVTAVLTILLRRLTGNYRATALLTMPFVVFFMAFAGFSMSIRRAGIMLLLSLVARALKREADALNSLGIAALIICVLNPRAAGDVGLLLSFASSFGLITLYSKVYGRMWSWFDYPKTGNLAFAVRAVLGSAAASVVSLICVFPITVLTFGEISLVAPVASVLCIYPASAFMICGAVAAVLYCIPLIGMVAGFAVYLPAWILGRLTLILTRLLSDIPGAGISVRYSFMPVLIALAFMMLGIWFVLFSREKQRLGSAMLCAALLAQLFIMGGAIYTHLNLVRQSIMVFSADDGIMTALVSGGRCVIIGTGGDSYHGWLASERLAKYNISDTLAVVLPDNTDRYAQNADDYIRQYQPEMVFLSDFGRQYEIIEQSCERVGADMYHVDRAKMSAEGCSISFESYEDENACRWIWAECGELSMLICPEKGDAACLPEEYISPDIAVVTSDGLINITRVDALATVISAEPVSGARAAATLEYRGVNNVYATGDENCIVFTASGQGIRVSEQ